MQNLPPRGSSLGAAIGRGTSLRGARRRVRRRPRAAPGRGVVGRRRREVEFKSDVIRENAWILWKQLGEEAREVAGELKTRGPIRSVFGDGMVLQPSGLGPSGNDLASRRLIVIGLSKIPLWACYYNYYYNYKYYQSRERINMMPIVDLDDTFAFVCLSQLILKHNVSFVKIIIFYVLMLNSIFIK